MWSSVCGRESPSREKAKAAGFEVINTADAASVSDVVMLLVPDELAPGIYKDEIEPNLRSGSYLAFAHGFSIHFKKIVPPDEVNVFMVAPKAPGHLGASRVHTRARSAMPDRSSSGSKR